MKFPMVANLKLVAMAVAITVGLSVSMARGEGRQVSLRADGTYSDLLTDNGS